MLVEPSNSLGQSRNVVGILQNQSVYAVRYDLGGSIGRCSNHGQTASHSFRGGLGKRIFKGWTDVNIGSAVIPLDICARRAEPDFVVQRQFSNAILIRSRIILARYHECQGYVTQ